MKDVELISIPLLAFSAIVVMGKTAKELYGNNFDFPRIPHNPAKSLRTLKEFLKGPLRTRRNLKVSLKYCLKFDRNLKGVLKI